jgi:hypothetical protein
MSGKSLVILVSAASLAALPGAAEACVLDSSQPGTRQDIAGQRSESGTDSYGDRNRGGPYGFYSYPRHRSVGRGLDRAQPVTSGGDASHGYDSNYGSAYYGRNYGAPYYGGAYYDRGTYYRERRD